MTNEQKNEIALTIARRVVWTSRPPESEEDLQKWLVDKAKEYNLTIEEFREFADFALESAFADMRVNLHNLRPKEKKIGFSTA